MRRDESEVTGERSLVIRTNEEQETYAVGTAFARALPNGGTISLEGPLGAGKTVFVRGLCAGLGVRDAVTSPTYTLHNEYRGEDGRRIIHLDCFRLGSAAELEDLGVDERREADTIVVVEWGERGLAALPGDTIRIAIVPEAGETGRKISIALPAGVAISALDPAAGGA